MSDVRTLGVILAGGAGKRVGGVDKGLLTVHGEPVIERVAAVLRPQCDDILIVANRHQSDYARIARVIGDEIPDHAGPLAGIAAALALVVASGEAAFEDCRWLLTAPVDCPDFPRDLFQRLHAAFDGALRLSCAYARDERRVQPLFALYSLGNGSALLESARAAAALHGSVLRWHIELEARPVDFRDETAAFHNLNAPKDFREYERTHPPSAASQPESTPGYPTRIGLEQALEIVAMRAAQHRLPIETVDLANAHGRVVAEDVRAPHPLPPFDNSAMDGFALRGGDLSAEGERAFSLIGEVFAGATAAPEVGPAQCVRITTGAPVPSGADTVVIKENVMVADGHVIVAAGERAGANVRPAGEDYAMDDLALVAGTPVGAAQLAVLAALGIAEVAVRRVPRIAVIATGDELVPAGRPLGFGQIHESNAVMLAALAREAGALVVAQNLVRDDPDALRAALLEAASDADVIVTSGGVSAGEADHLPRVLQTVGEIHFHKLRFKPGMPTLFGQVGASLYFGLPGNPVASAVTFRVFVRFALRAMLGISAVPQPRRARLTAPLHKRHQRAELARCSVHVDPDGVQWTTLHAKQGSGMLRGLAESDALALLPEGAREYVEGDIVTLWPC